MSAQAIAEAARRLEAAKLTKGRLIAIKRLADPKGESGDKWATFWEFLKANFPLDESIFSRDRVTGVLNTDPIAAAIRDGQSTVLLFIRKILDMPTPGDDDDETEDGVIEPTKL